MACSLNPFGLFSLFWVIFLFFPSTLLLFLYPQVAFSQFSSNFTAKSIWNTLFPGFLRYWILNHPAHCCHNCLPKTSIILCNSLSHRSLMAPTCLLNKDHNLFMTDLMFHKQPYSVFFLFCSPLFSWMFQTSLLIFMLNLHPKNFSSLSESNKIHLSNLTITNRQHIWTPPFSWLHLTSAFHFCCSILFLLC